MTYDVGSTDPGLGQAQKCGRIKSVKDPNPRDNEIFKGKYRLFSKRYLT